MSKSLFINGNRIVLDTENNKFPQSYRVNDLENPDVVNLPVTKTIEIPRCNENDEVFGYIAEFSRNTVGLDDYKNGISFNQTKRANYELYNGSEVVSKGLITIDMITENSYSIILVDELISTLEDMDDVMMNNNPLYSTNTYYDADLDKDVNYNFGSICYPTFIDTLNTDNNYFLDEVKPVFNIQQTQLDKKTLRCKEGSEWVNKELPIDCTPMNLRCFKDYDVEYAVKLSNIFFSINKWNPTNGGIVELDSSLDSLVDETYMLMKKPIPLNEIIYYNSDEENFTTTSGEIQFKQGSSKIFTSNGQYNFNLDLEFIWARTGTDNPTYINSYTTDGSNYTNYTTATADEAFIGNIWVKTYVKFGAIGTSDTWNTKPQITRVELLKNVNCYYDKDANGKITKFKVNPVIPHQINVYNRLADNDEYTLYYEILTTNPDVVNQKSKILGSTNISFESLKANGCQVTVKPITTFRSWDYLNYKNCMPNISYKEFILQFVKYFNLGLRIKNGKINIFKKVWYESPDTILLDIADLEMNTGLFDYDKVVYSSNISTNELIADYEAFTKQKYGQQVVNTGYTIRKNQHNVTFSNGVPALMNDTNAFTYDRYCSKYLGGFAPDNVGVTTGLDDMITFGYLNKVNSKMIVSTDSLHEQGYQSSTLSVAADEEKFVQFNPQIVYTADVWTENEAVPEKDVVTYYKQLDYFYTFSPYKFNGDGTIAESLELNKPKFNYANIDDSLYSDSSTHFYRFFDKQLRDFYSTNTNTIKGRMYIDNEVNLYGIYNIKGSYYIIYDLPEYDLTEPGMYEVTMLKINDTDNYMNFYNAQIIGNSVVSTILNTQDYTSLIFGGRIDVVGGYTISERGVLYSKTYVNPTVDNSTKIIYSGTDSSWLKTATDLDNDTTYFVRAYIITSDGVIYGKTKPFSTIAYTLPGVTNGTPTQVESVVTFNGTLDYTGGLTTNVGFMYRKVGTSIFTTLNSAYNTSFTYDETLIQGTNYEWKSFATNSLGTSYGNLDTYYVTVSGLTNTLSSACLQPRDITYTSMDLQGYVSGKNPSFDTVEVGFCWSTTNNTPTIADSTVIVNSTTNFWTSYNYVLSGLTNNTTYYITSYVKDSSGTYAYSSTVTQKTNKGYSDFTVSQYAAAASSSLYISVNQSHPIINGSYVYPTYIRLYYSTNADPLTGSYITIEDAVPPISNINKTVSGLNPNTTYYFQVKSQGASQLSYSSVVSYKTAALLVSIIGANNESRDLGNPKTTYYLKQSASSDLIPLIATDGKVKFPSTGTYSITTEYNDVKIELYNLFIKDLSEARYCTGFNAGDKISIPINPSIGSTTTPIGKIDLTNGNYRLTVDSRTTNNYCHIQEKRVTGNWSNIFHTSTTTITVDSTSEYLFNALDLTTFSSLNNADWTFRKADYTYSYYVDYFSNAKWTGGYIKHTITKL